MEYLNKTFHIHFLIFCLVVSSSPAFPNDGNANTREQGRIEEAFNLSKEEREQIKESSTEKVEGFIESENERYTQGLSREERIDTASNNYQVAMEGYDPENPSSHVLGELYSLNLAETIAAADQMRKCWGTPDPDNPDENTNPASFLMFQDVAAYNNFNEQVEKIVKRVAQNEALLQEHNGCKDEQINELARAIKLHRLYMGLLDRHINHLSAFFSMMTATANQSAAEDIARQHEINARQRDVEGARSTAQLAVILMLTGIAMALVGLGMMDAAKSSTPFSAGLWAAGWVMFVAGVLMLISGIALFFVARKDQDDHERRLKRAKAIHTMTCPFSGCYKDGYTYKYHAPEAHCEEPEPSEQQDTLLQNIQATEAATAFNRQMFISQDILYAHILKMETLIKSSQAQEDPPAEGTPSSNSNCSNFDANGFPGLNESHDQANNCNNVADDTDITSGANAGLINAVVQPAGNEFQILSIMPETRTALYVKMANDSEMAIGAAHKVKDKMATQLGEMIKLANKLGEERRKEKALAAVGGESKNNQCADLINKVKNGSFGLDGIARRTAARLKPPNLLNDPTKFTNPGLDEATGAALQGNNETLSNTINFGLTGDSTGFAQGVQSLNAGNERVEGSLDSFAGDSSLGQDLANSASREGQEKLGEREKVRQDLLKNGGGFNKDSSGGSGNSSVVNNSSKAFFLGGKGAGKPKTADAGGGRRSAAPKSDSDKKEEETKGFDASSLLSKIGGLGGGSNFGTVGGTNSPSAKKKTGPVGIDDANKKGFSDRELAEMRGNNPKTNPKYKKNQYDSLWDGITKAYFRIGIPRLFDIEKEKAKKKAQEEQKK